MMTNGARRLVGYDPCNGMRESQKTPAEARNAPSVITGRVPIRTKAPLSFALSHWTRPAGVAQGVFACGILIALDAGSAFVKTLAVPHRCRGRVYSRFASLGLPPGAGRRSAARRRLGHSWGTNRARHNAWPHPGSPPTTPMSTVRTSEIEARAGEPLSQREGWVRLRTRLAWYRPPCSCVVGCRHRTAPGGVRQTFLNGLADEGDGSSSAPSAQKTEHASGDATVEPAAPHLGDNSGITETQL